jgi:hypothetical protein
MPERLAKIGVVRSTQLGSWRRRSAGRCAAERPLDDDDIRPAPPRANGDRGS